MLEKFGTSSTLILLNFLVSKAQRPHGPLLISQELLFYLLLFFSNHFLIRKRKNDLRCPFNIDDTLTIHSRLYQRGHILAFCRERQLVNNLRSISQLQIVYPLPIEPKQQRYFSGISHTVWYFASFSFQESGRIHGDAL